LSRSLRRLVRTPVLRASDRALACSGLYRAEVNSSIGFFAQMSGLMTILHICERSRLKPALKLTSPLYADAERGPDFLSYFFDGPEYTPLQRRIAALLPVRRERAFDRLPAWSRYDYPALDDSSRLFARYYRLKPDVTEEVRAFVADHFRPGQTLGIHFRGTDKLRSESSALRYESVAQYLRNGLKVYPALTRLFVSTDEEEFLTYIKREFTQLSVSAYTDHVRSSGGEAIHTSSTGQPYLKGRDALLNCLLLAECDVLLKTMSNLSGWARVFRPGRPTYLLNRPDKAGLETLGFPEREMVERGWFADDLLASAQS
jgi:hypothetical protein